MSAYLDLKARHQKRISEFPITFAFSKDQLLEAIKKLNVQSKDELISTGYGGIIRKTDKDAYLKMMSDFDAEFKYCLADDENLKEAMVYELGSHEYCITRDPEDTLGALGIGVDEFEENERYRRIFKLAEAEYLAQYRD